MTTDSEILPEPYNQHVWPENLFSEMYDMCIISFMIYQFGYLLDAARQSEGHFTGLTLDESNYKFAKSQLGEDSDLKRSFTPAELKVLVQKNIEILSAYKKVGTFRERDSLDRFYKNLDFFTERAATSTVERPITVEEFDDSFQSAEPVYGLCRDAINKRIILVFRGSDSTLAFWSNWKANVQIVQKKGFAPESIKNELERENISFHSGFYNYLFSKTKSQNDGNDVTKYDQLSIEVKSLLAKNPGFKVYVTGHSLGAALSTIAAFYLSCDPEIPKPVSNINFASPRVGNMGFLKATQFLERTSQLRILRSVNENDSVTVVPSVGYKHVGFQVTTYAPGRLLRKRRVRRPDITYPNLSQGPCGALARRLDNSFLSSLNLGYDHGAYLKRIVLSRHYLENFSLNELYSDEDMVGYRLVPTHKRYDLSGVL